MERKINWKRERHTRGNLQEERRLSTYHRHQPTSLRNVALIPLLRAFHEISPRRERMNGFSFSLNTKAPKNTPRGAKKSPLELWQPLLMEASLPLSFSLHIGVEFLLSPPKKRQGKCRKMGQTGRTPAETRRKAPKSRAPCMPQVQIPHARKNLSPFPHPFTTHSLTFDNMCVEGRCRGRSTV